MSTHPYIPLYVDDYEAATAHLTVEEDGVYSRLLRLCWRTPGCSLPNDPAWIARKIRLSATDFERIARPVIDEFFREQRGRLVQRRLKAEYDDISRKKSARKQAGKKGGQAKALKEQGKSPSNASVLLGDTRAFPEPEPEPEPEEKEAIASSVGPEAPTNGTLFEDVEERPDGPKAKPWESSPAFAAFWARCGPQMRTRSSKAKAWQPWRSVVAKIGAEALLAAVGRYVASDPDFQRSGGPGVHLWLKDGRWEHWLAPAPGSGGGGGDPVLFPEREVRQACVIEFGEDWVRKNLDHCAWQQVPEKVIRAPNKFIAGNLHREASFFRALGIHSVKIKSEAAA